MERPAPPRVRTDPSTEPRVTDKLERMAERGVAVVTGASSGIGAATARALAKERFAVVVGARLHQDVAPGAARETDPSNRDRPRPGGNRVQPGPIRRRDGTRAEGL